MNRLQTNKYQRNLFYKPPSFIEKHGGLIFVVYLFLLWIIF